jgi:thymidylate kinase
MLGERLCAFGIRAVLTREPGGSPGAEIMRYVLLSGAARPLGPNAEAVLFAAARDDHLTTLIRPALARPMVVCDHFADSTRIYRVWPATSITWRSGRWSASSSATPNRTSLSSSTSGRGGHASRR